MVLLLMEMCIMQSSFHVKKKCETTMVSYTSSSFYSVDFFSSPFLLASSVHPEFQRELLQGEVKPTYRMGSLWLTAGH